MRIDHRACSARNLFGTSPVPRAHARRRDAPWLEAQLADASTSLALLWRSKHLVSAGDDPHPVAVRAADVKALLECAASVILLGQEGAAAWFAVDLQADVPPPEPLTSAGEFRDLREIAPLLSDRDAALLCQARALAHWHRQHRYCGVCGQPTQSAEAGHLRRCTNTACGRDHFPRTDPAVIVLVTSKDRCLLGRQAAWPGGRYSALAGFVEPGESLEEAVAREVEEETGVVVGPVGYHSSQPWPFPASLMVGFTAEAETDEIRLDDELEDARWFSRSELRAAVEQRTLLLPGPISISYRLIEGWFDQGEEGPLEALTRAEWWEGKRSNDGKT